MARKAVVSFAPLGLNRVFASPRLAAWAYAAAAATSILRLFAAEAVYLRIGSCRVRGLFVIYLIVMLTGVEAMPFATTSSWLAPRSIFGGTRKVVVTTVEPVATPMELGL